MADTSHISVMISEELRALWRQRGAQLKPAASAPEDTPAYVEAEPSPVAAQSQIRLRRDGERPLVFQGALVWQSEVQVPTAQPALSYRHALYLAQDGSVLVASSVEPAGLDAFRPSFQCSVIADAAHWRDWLETWKRTALAAALNATQLKRRQADDCLPAALQTHPGSSPNQAAPFLERNETCLQ